MLRFGHPLGLPQGHCDGPLTEDLCPLWFSVVGADSKPAGIRHHVDVTPETARVAILVLIHVSLLAESPTL